MRSKKKIWLGIGALVGMLAVGQVVAQVAQDFPSLKGFNGRNGRNGDPGGTNPGPANLRWASTDGTRIEDLSGRLNTLVVDNTDTEPPYVHPTYGTYFDTEDGFVTSTAGWNIGTGINAAEDAYTIPVRKSAQGGEPRNTTDRPQYYLYTDATASRLGGPVTTPENAGSLQTFTWNITPNNTLGPTQYELYLHIPIQPTLVGVNVKFPQQHYVVEIIFDGNRRRVEQIDTYQSGGGWVRLGANGQPTSALFGYNGTNPIQIRLYNTVPRNDNGTLKLPNGITNASDVLVYADAVRAIPQPAGITATPTSARLVDTDINSTVVTVASNKRETGDDFGDPTSTANSVVTNYDYQNGDVRWKYFPLAESTAAILQDDDQAAFAGAAWIEDPTFPRNTGDGARVAPVDLTTPTSEATYTFNVPKDGSYAVYAYIPTLVPGRPLAHGARYEVVTTEADGSTTTTPIVIDQSTQRGWVRIGSRFVHDTYERNDGDVPRPLLVRVTNFSADGTDGARNVYIDAIRVVGEDNLAITSSPVHANALVRVARGAPPVERKVVFIADEKGVIHCLDATGNGDGTTREYWSYPSTRDSQNYDPNTGPITGNSTTVFGEDWSGPGNTPAAERGSTADPVGGFGLSTGLVVRRNTADGERDFFYIAAANGRVYCIDVAGRGDNDGSVDPVSGGTRTVGTTTRAWTFPNTYPSPNVVTTSPLGSFQASIAESNGQIFVPTTQGRMYALDAAGNANKTTNVNWAYPGLNQPTLGPIVGTPSIDFGRIYFGTNTKLSTGVDGDLPGRIYALNLDGTEVWTGGGFTGGVPYFQRVGEEGSAANLRRTDNFQSGLITVPGALLGGAEPNTLFALNENRVLYSIAADTGELRWVTDELQTGAVGSLGFSHMIPLGNLGTVGTIQPVVLVPGSNGQFKSILANSAAPLNDLGGREAWGKQGYFGSGITASMANSNGWLYGADRAGFVHAWSTGAGISVPGFDDDILIPNNPAGNMMRKSKIRLISRDMYRALRQPEDAGRATYAQAIADAGAGRDIFEWGQTAYVLVYDFPYLIEDPDGDPVDPPIVNISFQADGRTVRGVSVQSRRFDNGDTPTDATVPRFEDVAPTGPMPGVTTNPRMNGYAVLAFPLQNGGANAVPPGGGEISFNIQTAGLTNSGSLQTVSLSPNLGPLANQAWSRIPFRVANPLAVVVPTGVDAPANNVPDLTANSNYSVGLVNDPSDPGVSAILRQEALMNGSADVVIGGVGPVGSDKRQSKLTTATPVTNHGSTGKTKVWIYDRSYMSLLRPGGVFGLDNVRLDRRDLGRQGGERGVYKRFDPAYYSGFEDLPVNYPNTSVDYPDVRSEQIKVTKEPNGSAENPLFSGVALRAPRGPGNTPLTESTLPGQRTFVPTEFELDVEIPKYQPPAYRGLLAGVPGALVGASDGTYYQQGYIGRLQVFVDSLANGQLDTSTREAFRSFNLTTSVAIDERLRVTTPTVPLGSLPAGTGYSPREVRPGNLFDPAAPLANSREFMHPWNGSVFSGAYKPFGVVNEGNVNLLNIRAARRSDINLPDWQPLSIEPTGNDPLSWLNGYLNIHTSIDPQYSPGPNFTNRPVALQKPRVSDRLPTSLSANAKRRQNSNLGVVDSPQNSTTDPENAGDLRFPVGNPKVGVSVPIGFPVGQYSTRLVVFEDAAPGVDHGNTLSPSYPADPIWSLRPIGNFNGVSQVVPGNGPEPFTEPGILLTFNVVESRLTNSYTPKTAPLIDNMAPTGGNANLRFQNAQPAATRDPNGSLVMAWVSNRTGYGDTPLADGSNVFRNATRLYFASLDSGANFAASSYSVPGEDLNYGSRLRDLGLWTPAANTQWFRQAAGNYPTGNPDAYFGGDMIESTVRYDNPAFPTSGFRNPFTGDAFNNAMLAFTGRGTRQTATGTLDESRLFVASIESDASGAITAPEPISMPHDPQVTKTEPSVLQTGNSNAVLFYTGVAAGQSWGYYTRVTPTGFAPASALPFGRGFLSTGGVSATGRMYTGARPAGDPASRPIAEVVFTGQLKGRPYRETFLGRAPLVTLAGGVLAFTEKADGTLADQVFEYLPSLSNEVLEREGSSLFRTRGVAWRRDAPIGLYQRVNGTVTSLLINETRTADRETGLITYDSRLGGRVTFDPSQGTVRFSTATPAGSAQLFMDYTPRFIRLSSSSNQGGGAAKATAMYDQRFISDPAYWRRGNGAFVTNEPITNDRLVLMWNRAAGGSLTARPFLTSLRFGVDLTTKLPTLPDGTPGYRDNSGVHPAVLSVEAVGFGPVDAYQVDPANGRIYVPQAYEGYTLRIVWQPADDSGAPLGGVLDQNFLAGYVTERAQEPVPIETAVNESSMAAFLDPFSYQNDRRPPLVWLFWTSTRGGVPDIYFQTIAPMWTPRAIAK